MVNKLTCRLCSHSERELIDVFSDVGKERNVAAKVLFVLSVLITENDPLPKAICLVCLDQIDSIVQFVATCRSSNYNCMNSLIPIPLNSSYKEEINKAMKVSIQSLYYNKHHLDISGVYDSLVHYMKNSESNQTSSQNKPESEFDQLVLQKCNKNNSCFNEIGTGIANSAKGTLPLVPTVPRTKSCDIGINGLDTTIVNPVKGILPLVLTEIYSSITYKIFMDATNPDRSNASLIITKVPSTSTSNIHISKFGTDVANPVRGVAPLVLSRVSSISTPYIGTRSGKILNSNIRNKKQNQSNSKSNTYVIKNKNTSDKTKPNSDVHSINNHCSTDMSFDVNCVNLTHSGPQFINRFKGAPIVITNINSEHDYSTHNISTTNKKLNVNGTTTIDDVICLDDDDDNNDNNDDDGNDDNSDVQIIVDDDVSPFNQWVDNNNSVNNLIVPMKNAKCVNKKILNINRTLVPCDRMYQSTSTSKFANGYSLNNSAIEMTVTPDISLPISDVGSVNGVDDCGSQTITPQTGFHFLYETDQTIDLTDETQPVSLKNKRKTKKLDYRSSPPSKKRFSPVIPCTLKSTEHQRSSPSLPVPPQLLPVPVPPQLLPVPVPPQLLPVTLSSLPAARSSSSASLPVPPQLPVLLPSLPEAGPSSSASPLLPPQAPLLSLPAARPSSSASPSSTKTILMIKSTKQVTKTRAKRTSAASAINKKPNPGLHKLGKQADTDNWKVSLTRLQLLLLQCPICEKYYSSVKYRELHEIKEHRFLPKSKIVSKDSESTLEHLQEPEEQEFFIYLNLAKQMSKKKNAVDQLAERKHLLTALKKFGNAKGSYKCQFCKYKSTRIFILWAHISSNHIQIDSDSRSNSYCFICNRSLNKRTNLLKHLDKCAAKQLKDDKTSGLSVQNLNCDICNYKGNSISDLENHFHNHVERH